MFTKKKVVVTPPAPTTQEMIASATKKIESDIAAFNMQKDTALGVFRQTANKLDVVNKGLAKSVESLKALMDFAANQAQAAEKAISDNEAVRNKILDIIGN